MKNLSDLRAAVAEMLARHAREHAVMLLRQRGEVLALAWQAERDLLPKPEGG